MAELNIHWQAPVLTLAGELSRHTVPQLWQGLRQYGTIDRVVLDDLEQVDTAGLAMLVQLWEDNPGLILAGASQRLRKLAELGDLLEILPFAE
ncbi:STAS domain-containing protein [Gallaecimonas sp. GXIMD4217]|uniref:STAS domain-containing protein n=1 Tax=Gallaecimonas sp. GXIMD4217 TaxID=3131927 RepID=UPI00311AEA91